MSEIGLSSTQRDPALNAAAQVDSDPQTELRVVAFTVIPYVPAGTDRHALAQQLADHLRTLTRAGTGEIYPVAADVFVIAKGLELEAPGQEAPNLLVHGWAQRPWERDGEWRHVVADFFEAVKAWFLEQYPVPAIQHPSSMPMVGPVSERLVGLSEFVAHTSGALPRGWAEHIAKHGAQLPTGPTG
ncbi:hypothetical protein ACFPH6_32760 [Streptomyces xiangluensis]|uniref:Uncharacterized protein n=1 Tax=Streptomyces xiangluensis TaxID=2665720 RepID=A0ABV8YYP2_9ACTN